MGAGKAPVTLKSLVYTRNQRLRPLWPSPPLTSLSFQLGRSKVFPFFVQCCFRVESRRFPANILRKGSRGPSFRGKNARSPRRDEHPQRSTEPKRRIIVWVLLLMFLYTLVHSLFKTDDFVRILGVLKEMKVKLCLCPYQLIWVEVATCTLPLHKSMWIQCIYIFIYNSVLKLTSNQRLFWHTFHEIATFKTKLPHSIVVSYSNKSPLLHIYDSNTFTYTCIHIHHTARSIWKQRLSIVFRVCMYDVCIDVYTALIFRLWNGNGNRNGNAGNESRRTAGDLTENKISSR